MEDVNKYAARMVTKRNVPVDPLAIKSKEKRVVRHSIKNMIEKTLAPKSLFVVGFRRFGKYSSLGEYIILF